MNRLTRRRATAGLLGLLALSLSLAEAGVASLCDPSMPMHRNGEVVTSEADDHSDDMAAQVAAVAGASSPDLPGASDDGMEPPPCPWMPMMGAGCTTPVVAPAVSTGLGTIDGCLVEAFRAARGLSTLHSTDPLLPPPRA